jgi:integrase
VEYRVSLHKWAKTPADVVMPYSEAKKLFRDWASEVAESANQPAAVAVPSLTLNDLATDYLRDYVRHPDRRPGAQKEMARQVAELQRVFGTSDMTAITKQVIEAWRLERRQAAEAAEQMRQSVKARRAADPTVTIPAADLKLARLAAISGKSGRVGTNRLRSRLQHLFTWAIEHERVETSPFTGKRIKKDSKAESGRTRRIEGDADTHQDEETRLLQHAGPHLSACIVATLETGLRRGEILGLTWGDISTAHRLITLPPTVTKTAVGRSAILTPRLRAVLDMRDAVQRKALELQPDAPIPPTLYPFGNEIGERVRSIKTAWRLTCQRAGIRGLRFHDLRREAGSRILEAPGVSLADTRDFLGHASVTQTNTYLASSTQRLRAAVEKRDETRTKLAHAAESADQPTAAPSVTH